MDKSGRPPVAISTPKNRNPKTQKCYRCIDPNVLPMSSLHAARLSPLTSHLSLLTSQHALRRLAASYFPLLAMTAMTALPALACTHGAQHRL